MRAIVFGGGITHTNHKNRPKFATLIGNSIRADLREFLLSVVARIFGRYTTMGTIAYGLDMYIKTLDLQFFIVENKKKTKQLLEISLAKYAHFNAYKHTFLCLVELVCQSSRMNLSSHCLVVGLSHGVIVILTDAYRYLLSWSSLWCESLSAEQWNLSFQEEIEPLLNYWKITYFCSWFAYFQVYRTVSIIIESKQISKAINFLVNFISREI